MYGTRSGHREGALVLKYDIPRGGFKGAFLLRAHMATSTVERPEFKHWLGFLLVILVTGSIATVIPVMLHFL